MTISKDSPPIYFKCLELKNVRCFGAHQTLDLTDGTGQPAQWTLILGDNGVGKTTLLQCLAWMRPVPIKFPEDNEDDDEPMKTGELGPALTEEENEALESLLRIGAKVTLELHASMYQHQMLHSVTVQRKEVFTGIRLYGEKGILRKRVLQDNSRIEDIGGYYGEIPLFAYGANRQMGSENLNKSDLLDPIASRLSSMTELYDAEEILNTLDYAAAKKGGVATRQLDTVKQVLIKLLPHVKKIEIFGPKIIDVPDEKSGIHFHTPYGPVHLHGLSLGYQTTMAWATDLAWRLFQRYPNSKNPLAEPAIVLVDEIDLHLHPRWQRIILDVLTNLFQKTQFIATAHSPLIVQAAANANLVVLRREGNHVVIEKDPQEVRGWRVDQILTSELFSVPSRDEDTERLFKKRDELLDKSSRTAAEEARLKQLEAKIAELPTAETREDLEAMDLIRLAALLLKQPRAH
jgi:predicted ATP-binding protein involved in virulence